MSDLPNEKPSKSQIKREMASLQKLGEELVTLSASQLAKIPLEDSLLNAIKHAQTITSHEGKRRQLQYIGKLMRAVDSHPIEQALEKIKLKHNENIILFHQVERWRDRFIEKGDETLAEFITQYPEVDHQQLRQLIRGAQQTKPGAERELFRYIREILENK